MRSACVIMMILGFALLAASALPVEEASAIRVGDTRETVVVYEYGFEQGLDTWATHDGTSPNYWNEVWSLSATGAYSGQSWWMHDSNIDGYTNSRYVVLDTPQITLPATNPELSFMIDWAMEDLGGTANYTAWDAVNVRLSTDDGDTWEVISGSPAYNANAVYAFGEIFGEGFGVPGWSGQSDGWTAVTMPLDDWAGQTVRIRFAFASDEATSTAENAEWFGVRVDDIAINDVFLANGDGAPGDDQMDNGYSGITSGDFWEVDNSQAHTGAASMHCPVMPNLSDELITPYFSLSNTDEPTLSYWVRADLPDADSDNDGVPDDYVEVYAKRNNESLWTRLHWFTGEDNAQWMQIGPNSGDYHGDCDLSAWAGASNVQLKFVLATDDDNDGGQGEGVWLDDVVISYATNLLPPVALTALLDFNTPELTWQTPGSGVQEGWIHWDTGENAIGVGLYEYPGELDVAARFYPADLLPYVGGEITSVRFYPLEAQCEYTIRIWSGANATLVYEEAVEGHVPGFWNELTLDEPYEIVEGEDIWLGYLANAQTGLPAGLDAGPYIDDRGTWLRVDGGPWEEIIEENPEVQSNLNMQAYVTAPDGRDLPLWPHVQQIERDDVLSGYIVERGASPDAINNEAAVISDPETLMWEDDSPLLNDESFYAVRAWYNGDTAQVSAASNYASVFVPSSTMSQMANDDGFANTTLPLDAGDMIATAFYPWQAVVVRQIEVYLDVVPTTLLPVRVWNDDSGMPGEILADFAVSSTWLHTGWNIFDLPHAVEVDGAFHAGIVGTTTSESVGVDTVISGFSSIYDGAWATYDAGTAMIRAWVDTNLPNNDTDIPAPSLGLSNYPNPFNPSTTVRFSLTEAGDARLDVYNLRGQRVTTLVNEHLAAGEHEITWNADGQASGVYLLRLQAGGKRETSKALLLK